MATETIMMTGDGYYEEGTKTPNATDAYTLIDDPVGSPDGSSTYISNNTTSIKKNSFTFSDLSIAGTIDKITIFTNSYTSNISYKMRPFVRIGGADYFGDFWNLTNTYADYSYDFINDPSTGVAWTLTGLNAIEIGFELMNTPDNKTFVYCTQLYAIVTYTISTSGNSGAILLCI